MNTAEKKCKADNIIKSHVLMSMGAGLVPVPLLDIAAVTAVQVDMLRKLSATFGIESDDTGKDLIIALTGGTIARVGASILKIVPGVGSILGGLTMVATSGASTYAVGQVFMEHFLNGGTINDFNPTEAAERYEEELRTGKEKAKEWQAEKKEVEVPPIPTPEAVEEVVEPTVEEKNETVLAQLERLAELRKSKVISEAEFKKMKKKLMAEV